ncbi:hypothetical protein QTP86_012217 [Hemibagrus guttatus]|nr:hypothetical protein QTP86_012217 [Hemibagrus guttatus]
MKFVLTIRMVKFGNVLRRMLPDATLSIYPGLGPAQNGKQSRLTASQLPVWNEKERNERGRETGRGRERERERVEHEIERKREERERVLQTGRGELEQDKMEPRVVVWLQAKEELANGHMVSEKVGGAEGTKLDEEFRDLEKKVDVTSKAVVEVISKTSEYLQPNPASRAKLSMLNTMSKIRGQVKSPGYPQAEGLLGECMAKYGRDLGEDTNFGAALIDGGESMKRLAEVKDSLDIDVKQNFIDPLQGLCDKDLREIQNTPHNILPVFNYSDVLLDIVVGGAVALFKCFRKRKRGKRAGALVKLRQRGFRTVLPSIHLANLRSLPNKMDELLLLSRTNKDFSNSAALCFTESWLNDAIPDSALNLPGFQLFRADRVAESAGKSRGGGTCFYINERWCTDVTVLKKTCCPDLEAFFINCKPFYSPREFSSFILVSVYIPPQAHVSSALQHLADEITHTEQQHPDSVIIILGDFNKANLSHELPKFKQHISCPTRDKNILDHCYTTIKDAYRSVPRAALGLSDHCLVHLLPTYRPKLKSAKPVVRTVKRWTSETEQDLQACFECTDWSIFEAGATDLDELTETVTSYISFCEDMCIPTRTYLSFNNDKPWFTSKLRHLRQAKEDAFRNGDRVLYNQARNTLNKEIRVAKRSYAKKLENQFSANDPASVWKGLKFITNYKTPSPSTEANQQLAEDLNEFYCRFETAGLTPHAPSEHLSIQPLTPPATPLSPPPALRISEDDVRQIFLKQKKRKAPGPDGVTPVCLRTCADQLAFIFSQIFNRSLELCEVPACFKRSTIIPIPKKPKITGLNDYRPVALTSVVMKSFERLVLAYLKNITGPLLDPLQFAYRANRSVDDAVNMGLHFILQHLDKSGTYVRLLFVDFSSAFNTIIPTLLQTKLTQLSVPSSICQWITSFLTDRHQLVKLGKFKSNSRTTSTGAPQGCVLSPLLFSLYTNDCTSTDPSIKLLKFADDTTVIGLIQDGDESAYRQEIEQLAAWCSRNNLELNTLKTVEMIVDFRRNTPALPPLTIMNSTVPTVASFRFLGTTISQDLKWDTHIDATIKKAQQRLYFLRQLRKFNLPQELLIHFYSAVIESVLCTSITVWFGSATKSDMRRLQRTVRTAERIIGAPLPTLQELYTSRHHLKKLEGRRLDYDYKKKRLGKIPDEEVKQALEKFHESKEVAEISMYNLLETDVSETEWIFSS